VVDFSYKRQPLGKQLKSANLRQARYAVILGEELISRAALTIKDLSSGVQQQVSPETLPRAFPALSAQRNTAAAGA
jgi:histidyl-tRNA synthetase